LKAIALIVEPASNSLVAYFMSTISQIYNFLSLPPVAIYFPLAEIDKPLIFDS